MKDGFIVITGAASGIGRATAHLFAKEGYPLLLIDVDEKNMNELVDEITEEQHFKKTIDKVNWLDAKCSSIVLDVAENGDNALHRAISETCSYYKRSVACMINNAGVMSLGDVATQHSSEWENMFKINAIGVLNGMKSVLPGMKQHKHGTIINISSVAGFNSYADHAAYCGSKFAVHGMTETVRKEVAPYNVRVCLVSPGVVSTHLLESGTTDVASIERYNKFIKEDCSGSVLKPEDVAQSILYAFKAPENVCIREIVICPTTQIA
jgi:NADP-dependent 3-hydroxy acid dehydrogenase YdfG